MNRFAASTYITHLMLMLLLTIVGCATTNKLDEVGGDLTKSKRLDVMGAYQPERPEFMSMNAGYLKINNLSDKVIYVVGVSSPDYQSVSIHESIQVDGMHKMESVDSIEIMAGETVLLEPGGMHLMLHMPVAARKVGDFTTIVFVLSDGSHMTFKMPVTSP
jgi:copper(I)-binding protein